MNLKSKQSLVKLFTVWLISRTASADNLSVAAVGESSTTVTNINCKTCYGAWPSHHLPTVSDTTTLPAATSVNYVISSVTVTSFPNPGTITFTETDTVVETVTEPTETDTFVVTSTRVQTAYTTTFATTIATVLGGNERQKQRNYEKCGLEGGSLTYPTAIELIKIIPFTPTSIVTLYTTVIVPPPLQATWTTMTTTATSTFIPPDESVAISVVHFTTTTSTDTETVTVTATGYPV
ncbi:hypothetical protein BX600DRAFT_439107 [Xylariales sp. PMI_506]|nr:hypothetical protein BX600DRAFT_439107 [Xylariales sp. PMI_506]